MCNALNPDRWFKVRNRYYLKSSGDFGKWENIKSSRINFQSSGTTKNIKKQNGKIVQIKHCARATHKQQRTYYYFGSIRCVSQYIS